MKPTTQKASTETSATAINKTAGIDEASSGIADGSKEISSKEKSIKEAFSTEGTSKETLVKETPSKADDNKATPDKTTTSTDTDGSWKHALDIMLFEFLQLFLPKIYNQIDVSVQPESKDTELRELLLNIRPQKRIVDKLVKAKLKNGKDTYLMIHIEVQSKARTHKQQQAFAKRMYEYRKLLESKYKDQPIDNIGVLINSAGNVLNIPPYGTLVVQFINLSFILLFMGRLGSNNVFIQSRV